MVGLAGGLQNCLQAFGFVTFPSRQMAELLRNPGVAAGIRLSHEADVIQATIQVNIDDFEELPVGLGPQLR